MADKHRDFPDFDDFDWDSLDPDEFADIPSEEEIAAFHKFSPEFEARMEKIFRDAGVPLETLGKEEDRSKNEEFSEELAPDLAAFRQETVEEVGAAEAGGAGSGERERKVRKPGRKHKAVFRILAAAACVVIVLSIWQKEPIRAEVVPHIVMEVFREWYDEFVEVSWGSNQKEAVKIEVVEPGYMPEGYELVNKIESENYYDLLYVKDEDIKLEITGEALVDGYQKGEDVGKEKLKTITIGGVSCVFYGEKNNSYKIEWVWEDSILYKVKTVLDEDEAKKVVESIIDKLNEKDTV